MSTKDRRLVEAGKRGSARRWSVPRADRLHELTPQQRRLVIALVEAAKSGAGGDGVAGDHRDEPIEEPSIPHATPQSSEGDVRGQARPAP